MEFDVVSRIPTPEYPLEATVTEYKYPKYLTKYMDKYMAIRSCVLTPVAQPAQTGKRHTAAPRGHDANTLNRRADRSYLDTGRLLGNRQLG